MRVIPSVLLMVACQGQGVLYSAGQPPLELTVHEPVYGAFLGDGPAIVRGAVTDPEALVWVEGRPVRVGTDGSFQVELPVSGDVRVIDVEASSPRDHLRQRVPVFRGEDPLATWAGGLSMRVTPAGLGRIARDLGPAFDDLGWAASLAQAVPGLTVTHAPSEVLLLPAEEGVQATLLLRNLELGISLQVLGLEVPVSLGFDEVALGGRVIPGVDALGRITLALGSPQLDLGEPAIEIGAIDPVFAEALLGSAADWLTGFGELLVDLLLALIGDLPLGAPLAFDTDLLGTGLSMGVSELYGDPAGVAMGVSVGIEGVSAVGSGDPPVPQGTEGAPAADLVVGLHEGLLQVLLTSDLVALLEQDLILEGMLANLVLLPLQALPGGNAMPADALQWCLSVRPGEARVARLHAGSSRFGTLYLPDLRFELGYTSATEVCAPWIEAALEAELGLVVDGTVLRFDFDVADGAVLSYGAPSGWTEDAVVAGLGGLLDAASVLLGGALEVDLSDALSGASSATGTGLLGALEPSLGTSTALLGDDGLPVRGMVAIPVTLIGEPAPRR